MPKPLRGQSTKKRYREQRLSLSAGTHANPQRGARFSYEKKNLHAWKDFHMRAVAAAAAARALHGFVVGPESEEYNSVGTVNLKSKCLPLEESRSAASLQYDARQGA